MKNMKSFLALILIFVCLINAGAGTIDTSHHNLPISPLSVKPLQFNVPISESGFAFDDLDRQISNHIASSMFNPPPGTDTDFATKFMLGLGKADLSNDVKKAQKICDKAIEIGRYIDKLTGGNLESMPVIKKQKLGSSDIYIIFQSAKIHPTYAEIEVYIKIDLKKRDFNGNNTVLYFGVKDLKFSQDKGLIAGAVMLLADYAVKMGDNNDKAGLYLKAGKRIAGEGTLDPQDDKYDGTYVQFDCDGFKEMGVGGAIFFSREWMIPTDAYGVPRPVNAKDKSATTPRVNGHFQFNVQSLDDWYATLEIDHFVLNKWDKMSFYLGQAHLDFSSQRSPSGTPYADLDDPMWEGVYIKSVGITLPEPFKRTCTSFAPPPPGTGGNPPSPPPSTSQTCRIKVSGDHIAIDDDGVSGIFSINGQAPLVGGPIMNGEWGWSLDNISITLIDSDVTGFSFGGKIGVPILSKDKPLGYNAAWDRMTTPTGEQIDAYTFDVIFESKKSFPVFNAADVTLSSTRVQVGLVGNEFRPKVWFSGKMTIGNPADYASSQGGSPIKMPGVDFTNLLLETQAPYISVESFTINTGSSESRVAGFPVTVTDPSFTTSPSNPEEVKLGFNLGINLMSEGSGVSATGFLAVVGEYKRDLNNNRIWKYKDFEFNGANVTVSFPQFYAFGQLQIFKNHPTYGNGFQAAVEVKILGDALDKPENTGKFKLDMLAMFGSNEGYRYWLVDGFVSGDAIHVPIFPPFYLDGFGGGAFHHMKPNAYVENTAPVLGQDLSGIVYVPSRDTKLGIKFATSFAAEGGLMSGLLTCIIRFGHNYALQNITFWGTADIMVPSELSGKIVNDVKSAVPDNVLNQDALDAQNKQKLSQNANKIKAKLGISFTFDQGFVFHGYAEVSVNLQDKITGSGSLDLYLNTITNKWHFYLGAYYGGIPVPGFFDPSQTMTLQPVNLSVSYGSFKVSAHAYFLTGNKIPGPPPPAPEVIAFFGPEPDNRASLNCAGRSPAQGTGIAFGASAFFDFEKVKNGLFKSCVAGYKIDIGGGLGFDLALLKYPEGSQCGASNFTSEGINGMRATGRVFAFVNIEKGHITCIPLPHLGIGVKLRFDVVKPSYFQGVVKLDFIKEMTFAVEWGDECGTPCSPVSIDD